MREQRAGSHPLLSLRGGDVRDDLVPAASDAGRESARRLVAAAAGPAQGDAADVRRIRVLLPGRPRLVLDDLERVADRAAVLHVEEPADRGVPRREGRWPQGAQGVHGLDDGAGRR